MSIQTWLANTTSKPEAATGTSLLFRVGQGGVSKKLTLASTLVSLFQTGTVNFASTQAADSVGTRGMPQQTKSAAYTLVITDAGQHILHPASDNNARTFTIPANSAVAFPIGTVITFINMINTVTIAITTDTLMLAGAGTTGSRTLAPYGVATAIKIDSTQWLISGPGLT
jgi:hypothetical protein